jgi:PKD repeat protein
MKAFSFKDQRLLWLFLPLLVAVVFVGCSDDDDDPEPSADPVASFQFEIDANDFLTVNFTNFSQNATSYDWDFGDGNSSTVTNPSHTYSAAGEYEVILIASNADGKTAMRSESITITDPEAARKLLTGETSKTWKLFREGTSMSLWDSPDRTQNFWPGLTNDGARPCLYEQEFTFHFDGTYEFNDNGMFWGEFGVWGAVTGCTDSPLLETCFDATAANMVNACGDDVSAWGSGTHQFSYDASTGQLTVTGNGAWIGIPRLATTGETIVPVSEVTTQISIESFTGYDVMTVEFIYAGTYWPIVYASYSDPSLEPDLVTDKAPFGEDYDDISPMSMGNAFDGTFDLLDTVIQSASNVVYGVEDPADAMAPAVGQFNRTNAQFQELQLQTKPTKNDINFENLTTVSLDVYLPSSNNYTGSLSKAVIIGLADKGATEQWWTDNMEYVNDGTMLAEDEWITLTYDLSMPSNAANGGTPFDRNDFDMIYINIGGSNHTETGTFYVRNLRFE